MGVRAMRGNTQENMAGIKAPYFDGTQPCTKLDVNLFFPDYIRGNAEHNKAEKKKEIAAKKVCSSCKFVSECLDYGLKETTDGIWGGTNPMERNRIRQARKLPPPRDISKLIDSLL